MSVYLKLQSREKVCSLYSATQIFRGANMEAKREHRIWLCGPVVILALLQISSGLANAVQGARNGTFNILIATEASPFTLFQLKLPLPRT